MTWQQIHLLSMTGEQGYTLVVYDCTLVGYDWRTIKTVHLLGMIGEQGCTLIVYDSTLVQLLGMTGEQDCTFTEYDWITRLYIC